MARKDKNEMTVEERREYRKKRRIRNQIMAYLVLIIIVIGIGAGGFYGVKVLINKFSTLVSEGNDVPAADTGSVSQDQFVMSSDSAGVISTPDEIVDTEIVDEGPKENEEARAYINAMSLEDKVAAMFIVSPEDITEVDTVTQAGEQMKASIDEYGVGGIMYTTANAQSADQFSELVSNTQTFYQTTYNNTMWLGYNGDNASDYSGAGLNMTITPADQFSLGSSGVLDCVTLFPFQDGQDMESTEESLDEMRENRFDSFSIATSSGADAIIMSNVIASNAGDNLPASLSYAMITETIRNELGFDGVIITGYMDEAAITGNYSAADAAIMAVNAGADMILCSDDFFAAYDGVLTAVQSGEISEERIDASLMRIYTAKYQ